MYTQCPHCDQQQAVSAKQLREQRGLLTCRHCQQRFDALPRLSEQLDAPVDAQPVDYSLPAEPQQKTAAYWPIGSWLLLLLLLVQIGYFEGERLLQQPRIRLLLQPLCTVLDCALPAYKNLDEWSLSHSDLQLQWDRCYRLTAALTNQASLPQTYPDLKLTLLNFNGQAFAERVFKPWHYAAVSDELAAQHSLEIRLHLAPPAEPVGGFTVSLL